MLYNNNFLEQLNAYHHKVIHVRIIAIDHWDHPVEAIEGQITSGTINISGDSAIQRTCNLSITALEGQKITEASWAFKNKFKVEIGLENHIDPQYEDIIWFKQGVFIVKSFSKQIGQNGNISISISGMDKMCMLNGSIGGTLTSDVNFGELDNLQDDGNIITTKVPIYTIIQKALQQFGDERQENIIINDLDKYGYELWTYRGDQPLYLIGEFNNTLNGIINMTVDQEAKLWEAKTNPSSIKLSEIEQNGRKYYSTNTLDPTYNNDASKFTYHDEDNFKAVIVKVDYGETAGYHSTELVYAGELIEKAGSTITNMLDKIVKMLGAFEYFYNIDGQFVFQKKKNYTQEIFSPIDGGIISPNVLLSQYSYQFKNKELITNLSYTPVIDKIRNDFTVWGNIKSASGADLPIHARCAIDEKPTRYKSYKDITYIASQNYEESDNEIQCDWRELIYQMAIDFRDNNGKSDYISKIAENNQELIHNGKTGYEQYYIDLEGFWRQLYNPEPEEKKRDEYYSTDDEHKTYRCWNKAIHLDPNSLKFWFDFLDPGNAPLSQYAAYNIGFRPKVNNSSAVKSIYYKETPEVLFLVSGVDTLLKSQLTYSPLWIPYDMKALFTLSTQGISAIEQINIEINNGACLGEGISFQTIPIYYLLPNTRIQVLDEDYLLTSIQLSFGTNATTMSLSGSKIIKSIV